MRPGVRKNNRRAMRLFELQATKIKDTAAKRASQVSDAEQTAEQRGCILYRLILKRTVARALAGVRERLAGGIFMHGSNAEG